MDEKKLALVANDVATNWETKDFLQTVYVLGGMDAVHEAVKKQFSKGKKYVTEQFGTVRLTSEECSDAIHEIIETGHLINKNIQSLETLIEQKATCIRYVPKEMLTEELCKLALEHHASIRDIPDPSAETIRYALLNKKYLLFGQYDFSSLSKEQQIECVSLCPDLLVDGHIPGKIVTKELFSVFLIAMVAQNKPFILGYPNKVYKEYMDVEAYRSYCMVHGYNFRCVPEELKEQVITDEIIHYCLDNCTSYISSYHLLSAIPEQMKTRDICLKACTKHFAAVKFLPKKYCNDEFYKELMAAGQYDFAENIDLNTISSEVLLELLKNRKSGTFSAKIPAEKWNKDLAMAVAKNSNALEIIPKKYMDYDVCINFIRQNGAYISEIPHDILTEELCLEAMRSNCYAAFNKIPEGFKTESFFRTVVREDCYRAGQIPEQYLTEEDIVRGIPKGLYRDCNLIPVAFRTDKVRDEWLAVNEQNGKIPEWMQSKKLFSELFAKNKKNLWKAFSLVRDFRPEFRDENTMEQILNGVKAAVEMADLTYEQLKMSIKSFPENLLKVPKWYFTTPEKGIKENAEIVLTEFKQMSIFDLLL